MFRDSKGRVWAGSRGSGLYLKADDCDCFMKFSEGGGESHFEQAVIFSIAEDSQGKIWCGTYGDGILIYDPNSKVVRQFSEGWNTLPFPPISYLVCTLTPKDKSIWAVSSEVGLIHFRDTKEYLYQQISIPNIKDVISPDWGDVICKDYKNRLWILLNCQRLFALDLSSMEWKEFAYKSRDEFPFSGGINVMTYNHHDSTVLITTFERGFVVYDTKNEKSALYTNNSAGVRNYTIDNAQNIYFSSNQDMYIGGFNDGFNVHYRKPG